MSYISITTGFQPVKGGAVPSIRFIHNDTMNDTVLLERIAKSLEKIASEGLHITIDHGHIEHIDHVDHIDAIDHTHIDDIGEIHGDVITHPKKF